MTSILEYNWLDVHCPSTAILNDFIELYSRFLSVLVSSLPKYLHEVTSKLVMEFTALDLSNHSILAKNHDILTKIIKFIPTSINSFPSILQRNFPHHLSSSNQELTNYVNNLMKIISYCPDLQFSIWQLIIECCIKLDVELQNELDDLDDEEIEELINADEENEGNDLDINIIEENKLEDKKLSEDEDENGMREGEVEYLIDPITSTSTIKALVSKLDSIISLLLTSTSDSFTIKELDSGNGVTLFNTITSLFRSHILPTHFTKLIQFVLFHISQCQPELADSFLVLLIDVAFNANEILEKRLKAMQYLSSYIARAKSLSRHQVVFLISYLIGWLNKYVMERECEIADIESDGSIQDGEEKGGMERFKLFYAAFQALLYIFCFRYKMLYKVNTDEQCLTSSSSESEWECELDKFFQRMIITKFNPLKFCDETVVFIFAKISTKLNVCYCYSIIEHNKRERILQSNMPSNLPSVAGNFKQKQEFLDLEAYFPFDPLVLPSSKELISLNYVEWSEVNPNDGEDDDDDSASITFPEENDEDEDEDASSDDEEITSDEDYD